jgi:hypothetical protein
MKVKRQSGQILVLFMLGATIAVHTNQPGANCSILVFDLPPAPGRPSPAGGLGPQIANGSGDATWTWTVEPTALVGSTQVQVQCSYRGLLGYASRTS